MSAPTPSTWILTTIGEIAELSPKQQLDDDLDVGFLPMSGVPTEYLGRSEIERKKWGDVKKGYTHFKNEDVLIAKITPCFENGKATIAENFPNGFGAGSTEYHVLRAIDSCVLPKLLLAIAKTRDFLINGATNMTGSVGHKRVPKDFVESYPFPLPPLAEQKQIAAKLDELLAQVDTLKARLDAIPAILKRFRQSVLAAAVSGRLTEGWRALNDTSSSATHLLQEVQKKKRQWAVENPEHNEAKRVIKRSENFKAGSDAAPDLPLSWRWSALEDATLMIVDCHNKTAPYEESGIALVRTTNVRDGKFNWNDLRYVNEQTYEYWSRRCPPESGDLVFTREAPMGEVAIVPAHTKICLGQRTMLIRPLEKLVSSKYLLLTLLDPLFKKRSESIAVGTGVKHYRVGDVSELVVPIAPTEEQTEIVRRVEQLFTFTDQIEQRVRDAQARVNHLTQSILAKAFRGELTADWRAQNPELISGDNSAEALLARIRAARANDTDRKKRGRSTTA